MNTTIHRPTLLILFFLCCHTAAFAFYNPTAGRWLSRDPIGEKGGVNICGFIQNNSIARIDAKGLSFSSIIDRLINPGFHKCNQITRDDGTPLIYFEPLPSQGGGWKMSRFDFGETVGSSPKVAQGFSVTWTATVIAYCKCGWDDCFKAKKGERVYSKTFDDIVEDWFPVYNAGEMPVDIPDVTSLLKSVGELIADKVASNLSASSSISSEDARDIRDKISANRPKTPIDGQWKGKAACDD